MQSINRHNDTLLPSWCLFQSTNHEATNVPAKSHLWVWTQGKDNYKSAPELQRRNFKSIVSISEPTKQSFLPVFHHMLWGYAALPLLLDPRRCQQGQCLLLGKKNDFVSDTGISLPPAYVTNSIAIHQLSLQSLQMCAPHCSSDNARKKLSFPSLCSSNVSAYLTLPFHWKMLMDGEACTLDFKQLQSFGEY